MSDWEDLCNDMGLANDEHAFDKLVDFAEGKGSKPYSRRHNQEFTPEQKRAYAIKKVEERRLLSTPIGQYVVSRWGADTISNIQEREWNKNGLTYKSMHFEFSYQRGKISYSMTITKCNDSSYCVKFCNHTGKWKPILCTEVSGNRLTPRLVEQAIYKNDAALRDRRRAR